MSNNLLAERMQFLREENGWTKTFVAKKIETKTLSTYANWEYGLREPDHQNLIKLADLYGVSTDYLLGRTENRKMASYNKEEDEFVVNIQDSCLKSWVTEELFTAQEKDLKNLKSMWEVMQQIIKTNSEMENH